MAAIPQGRTVKTEEEKDYFKQLGSHLAQLRRTQGLTQVQLAEALGISQQVVASYEIGRRRIPVSLLPQLARALSVGVDELLGEKTKAKRGPAPVLARHMERISKLPKLRQKLVIQVLESMLAQPSR